MHLIKCSHNNIITKVVFLIAYLTARGEYLQNSKQNCYSRTLLKIRHCIIQSIKLQQNLTYFWKLKL